MDTYPLDGSFNELQAPDVTAWKLTRSAIEHENHLVNHRLTLLTQTQVFLFSAFVLLFIALTHGDLKGTGLSIVPWLLATIGLFALYTCLVIQTAVSRAYYALDALTAKYNELADRNGFRSKAVNGYLSRTPPLHYWKKPLLGGIWDEQALPGALACVWVVLLGILGLSSFFPAAIEHFGMKQALLLLAFVAVLLVGYILGSRKSKSQFAYDD